MSKMETRDDARRFLELIQRAVQARDYAQAGRLEKQLWEEALEAAAMHICRTSPSDLCATALTSRRIEFKRGYELP